MAATKRTVLITGCSKNSIGDALAQEFLKRGLNVIATARSLSKINHLADLGADIRELDITNSTSIEALANGTPKLDILINNAGIAYTASISDTSMTEFKRVYETNVFGTVELTKAFLPALIASKGIIVNHTSQSAYAVNCSQGAYASSKAALAVWNDILRLELSPFGVRVMELVTGGAASNVTNDLPRPVVPEGSLYAPIRAEIFAGADPERVRKMVMAGDVYAKKVVSDVLRPRGPPVWTWRGSLATTMWVFWFVKGFWKGGLDWLLARVVGLHLLRGRLEEQERKKEK
jgi:1-acylglycerone phosphate reductase